jgi:hypothetical protein
VDHTGAVATTDWSRVEVEAIVDDYLSMLASELSGTPYNKAAHRRALREKLSSRSESSIEFKHANISAALLEAGFPYINGYKPRSNYQALLADVIAERLDEHSTLLDLAVTDADRPIAVPEVEDILAILTKKPQQSTKTPAVAEPSPQRIRLTTNYLEREARNRSLGNAGEALVLSYERERLVRAGKETLAGKIEHTAKVRGDSEGYDILSYEESGRERLIEVKTTKYGGETPFYVSRNEVAVSKREAEKYQVYRLFDFRKSPCLYTLPGAIESTCALSPTTFLASPK